MKRNFAQNSQCGPVAMQADWAGRFGDPVCCASLHESNMSRGENEDILYGGHEVLLSSY